MPKQDPFAPHDAPLTGRAAPTPAVRATALPRVSAPMGVSRPRRPDRLARGSGAAGARGADQPVADARRASSQASSHASSPGLTAAIRCLAGDPAAWLAMSGGGERGGGAIALSDQRAIVGVGGAAYVFELSTGRRLAQLSGGDGAVSSGFGAAVAVTDDWALVGAPSGAPLAGASYGPGAGSVSAFQIPAAGAGAEALSASRQLTASDGAPGDQFGGAIALDSGADMASRALIGAMGAADQSGAVYLVALGDGAEIAKLRPETGAARQYFGAAAAIDERRALIGAVGDASRGPAAGAAYLFHAASGAEIAKLTAPDGGPYDQFGAQTALCDGAALVSARDASSGGAVYVFDAEDGRFTAKLVASDDPRDGGAHIALAGGPHAVWAIPPLAWNEATAMLSGGGADAFPQL